MTRIAIAASSAVVRAGLEALLSATPGWEVAGSFADASHLDSLRPDVLVAALPISELPVLPAIVLLTSEGQPEWTAEAIRSGVRALLPRDAPAAAILAVEAFKLAGDPTAFPDQIGEQAAWQLVDLGRGGHSRGFHFNDL